MNKVHTCMICGSTNVSIRPCVLCYGFATEYTVKGGMVYYKGNSAENANVAFEVAIRNRDWSVKFIVNHRLTNFRNARKLWGEEHTNERV